MNNLKTQFEKNEIICKEGEHTRDLYLILSGRLMVCTADGHMVTSLAYIEQGQYFGEFSFFDNLPRSATVIAIEPTQVLRIPSIKMNEIFPYWLLKLTRSMTSKIRLIDEVIAQKGIRKKSSGEVKALSIDEQRHYYNLINAS